MGHILPPLPGLGGCYPFPTAHAVGYYLPALRSLECPGGAPLLIQEGAARSRRGVVTGNMRSGVDFLASKDFPLTIFTWQFGVSVNCRALQEKESASPA